MFKYARAGYQIWSFRSRSPDSTFPFERCAWSTFLASQSFKGQAHLKILQSKKNPDFLNKKIRALSSTFQNRFITCQKFYHRVASDLKPTL